MTQAELGLRERKKLRTREAIVEAAFALFAKQGFDETTIAEIAEAAEIAPRTFFSYFPSKEDVVFADYPEMLDSIVTRMDERRPGETAIDAMQSWIGSIIEEQNSADSEREATRERLISETEALAARERDLRGRFQSALAEALERDLGDELQAQMVAAAAVAALCALEDTEIGEQKMAVVEEALSFVRGGMAGLKSVDHTAA